MWTSARRKAFARFAARFDGVLVLGCEATVELVRDALGSTDCRVIRGMETVGIMNILPTVRFPLDISLEVHGMTPTTMPQNRMPLTEGKESRPWMSIQ